MDLGFKLNLEQKQELVMTPRLQQAIELLQFNSIELLEYIKEEIAENPLLELLGDNSDNLEEYGVNSQTEYDFENLISYELNLYEFLENQLYLILNKNELDIARYIIGNLDQSGFLNLSIETISKDLNISIEKVKKVLEKVQKLEPSGIAARNLQETLLIQLDNLLLNTNLAEKIVKDYLELLAKEDYEKIIKKSGQSKEKVLGAINLIKTLNPQPAAIFSGEEKTAYIIPDIIVQEKKDKFEITINEQVNPTIGINPYYYKLLKDNQDEELSAYLEKKYKGALWLIKSIEQRRITIEKISKAIIDKQEDFFKKGIEHLHPLTMEEIAQEIKVHESTVSRATTDKYIQTPQGIFSFKFFFNSGAGNYASVSIKAILDGYIKKEDKNKPLTDQSLVDFLKKEEINISRRTVAKYRKEMGIPSSRKRKKV